ncbi:HCNGP-like protein [Hirsutella rhossiliensis]|uniref:HCNGP-like protein n=1 Tax=Hirsutella rhossiliensis TaxID=111463 RepID=A0A9P8N788_9HYPO|nr:HCNGP-like protein [Hirsutella rhossiliensis]KAH0967256.1 HCNGP-like protein [Hirsutella rhossiliensis]
MEASAMAGDWYQAEGPASPYSANRALIHDLTLPSIPNLDIPPSPSGSPPPRASKSFEQFLALKKNGTHFNSKLEQSTALRNPGVMDKLMDFVGLDERQQYETTLSPDLWNPAAFPETAFVEKLRKSREKIANQREADKASGARSSVDFVPSTATIDANASVASGLSRGDKSRSSWR